MTEWVLGQVAVYGAWILFIVTFLSCLALPIPASLAMMAGGAFVGAGDLSYLAVSSAAFGGAMVGDQTGYNIGKHGGRHIRHKITSHPKRAKLFLQAQDLTHKHGGIAIFLSRWALSPLGPYANVAGGIVGMNRLRFTLWGAAGEAVWVLIYITLGLMFADQIIYAAEVASDLSGLLVALVLTFGFGHWLWKRWRDHHRHG